MRWVSLADDADLAATSAAIERDIPVFLDELTRDHRSHLAEVAPALSWIVHEEDLPVAVVRAAALRWDGTVEGAPAAGAGEAVTRAGEDGADTLAVLDVTVAFGARGRGVGRAVMAELDARRREQGLARTLLLLRPHRKVDYPLLPFDRYVSFATSDGEPFDPWLRVAWRLGYRPVRAVQRSLRGRADLASWERWLGLAVPGSGPYLVDGAIKPAVIEIERGEGRYREPHLWAGATGSPQPPDADDWIAALAAAGVVAGDRSHREGGVLR